MQQMERRRLLAACSGLPVVLAMVGILFLPGLAFAEPKLQLYSPQGEFDPVTETWVIDHYGEFELWLLASTGPMSEDPISLIRNVRITLAVPEDEFPAGGSVTVGWLDGLPPAGLFDSDNAGYPGNKDYTMVPKPFDMPTDASTLTLGFEDSNPHYMIGTPYLGDPAAGIPLLPPHGEYPAPFTELYVGHIDTKGDGAEYGIWDAQVHPDSSTTYKLGQIYKLSVEVEGFSRVHIDAHDGILADTKYSTLFAPFSHDAEYIPEPVSFAFFGLIAAGGVVRAIRRRRQKS